jgi:hypothetical protein
LRPAHQLPELVLVSVRLRPFASLRGLRACERFCLDAAGSPRVWSSVPALRYAMLIPWVEGPTWLDVVLARRNISATLGAAVARSLAASLAGLEALGGSHGDVAAGNVIFDPLTGAVELIDVEHLYAPGFAPTSILVLGTPGYNLVTTAEGAWSPWADRFAAAVLLSEMLTWHNPEVVRRASGRGAYFDPSEIQSPRAPRVGLLADALGRRAPIFRELFLSAWSAPGRAACPSLREWSVALERYVDATASTIPVDVPTAAPTTRQGVAPTCTLTVPPQPPVSVAHPPPTAPSVASAPPIAAMPAAPTELNPVAFWRATAPPPRPVDDPVERWVTHVPKATE